MKVDEWIRGELLSRFGEQKYVDWAVTAFEKAWPEFERYKGAKVRDVPETERLALCLRLTAGHEGCVPYMYCDSVGLVTAGVGTMIDADPDHGADLKYLAYEFPWKSGGALATREDVLTAHAACKSYRAVHPKGHATDYAGLTALRITEDQAYTVAGQKLRGFADAMFKQAFPNTAQHRERFPDYPVLAAVVMIDMAFGLGNAGFDRFKLCNAKLAAGQWEEAARASLIKGASYTTLIMHYMLLRACAGFVHTGAPDGTKAPHEDEPPPPAKTPTTPTTQAAGVSVEVVLDVPTLSQGNPKNDANSKLWCGRTSACMVHNYYRRVDGKTDLVVNSPTHRDLVYPDGTIAASGYALNEPLERAKAGWTRVTLFPQADRELPLDEAGVRAVLQPALSALEQRNPLVAYTALSKNEDTARHLIVFSGFRIKDGALWLHVDDPSTMRSGKGEKGEFLGARNLELISEGVWQESGSRYWLRASRLFEPNDHSAATSDLWCDHCDRGGLTVFLNGAPTPASAYSHERRGPSLSLPLDLGGGLEPTPANVDAYYAHVEQEHEGGYFPLTTNSLWHGGVHLHAAEGASVHALSEGEVVAARLDPDATRSKGAFGGLNFIVMRHAVSGRTLNDAASEPARLGFRLLSNRNLRPSASTTGDPLGLLRAADVVHLVDPAAEPTSADGLPWYQVRCEKVASAALQGKTGWLAHDPAACADVHGARSAAFDDAGEYAWFSLFLHLAAEPLDASNERLREVTWLAAPAPAARKLSASVGRGGKNARADVTLAQELLEQRGHPCGGADGVAGAKTIEAIEAFQKGLGRKVDGRLDPDGGTWRALDGGPAPATLDAGLVAALATGDVVKVGRRVRAGEKLWTVGAGPSGASMLHLETFAADLLLPKWRQAIDESEDWNVDCADILRLLQQTPSEAPGGALPPDEVVRFFREDHDAAVLRRLACRFVSEWAVDVDKAIDALAARWVTPGLKERLAPYSFYEAARAVGGLPDRLHWHYHPIALLEALADGATQAARAASHEVGPKLAAAPAQAVGQPTHPSLLMCEAPGGPGSVFVTRAGKRVPFFAQGDAPWGERLLAVKKTVSEAGCAITSVAMILRYYGRAVDPGTLDKHLDDTSGYTGDSMKWVAALGHGHAAGLPALKHGGVVTGAAAIKKALDARLGQGHPTLARVDYGSDANETYNHFVVIVGKDGAGRFIMNDPGTRSGDGASDPRDGNVIGATDRHSGYTIVQLDLFDVEGETASVGTDALPGLPMFTPLQSPGPNFSAGSTVSASASAGAGSAAVCVGAAYGGHALRQKDDDATRRWGGAVHAAESAKHVEALQRDLVGLGYWVSAPSSKGGMNADGDFGLSVHGAVVLFQREHGLKETGVVDAATAQAIKARPQGSYVRPGHAPKNVAGATFFQLPPSTTYGRYGDLPYDASRIAQDNWGTRAMIDMLTRTGAAWAKVGKGPFLVGDVSLYDGGYMSPHKTHKDGTGVDVAGGDWCDIRRPGFDKEQSVELAKAFVEHGAERILFNCKHVIDSVAQVKSCDAHHHHFHIDVVDHSISQPKAAIECLHCHKDVYKACKAAGKRPRTADELSS